MKRTSFGLPNEPFRKVKRTLSQLRTYMQTDLKTANTLIINNIQKHVKICDFSAVSINRSKQREIWQV